MSYAKQRTEKWLDRRRIFRCDTDFKLEFIACVSEGVPTFAATLAHETRLLSTRIRISFPTSMIFNGNLTPPSQPSITLLRYRRAVGLIACYSSTPGMIHLNNRSR